MARALDTEDSPPLFPSFFGRDRMELAAQHGLLKGFLHGRQALTLDTEHPGPNLIVQRLPQFVDGGDGVVQGQERLKPRLLDSGNGPAKNALALTFGLMQLAAER